MPPTNTTPSTAVVISSLPYTTTQDVSSGAIPYTVWYTYTPTASDVVLSVQLWGEPPTYNPTTRVAWDNGGGPGLSVWRGISNYAPVPVYLTVVTGQQLWFRAAPTITDGDPATLTVTVESFTQGTAPQGSIFINDASSAQFPAALLSSTTGDPLQYVNDFPGGEQMVQLLDGTILVQNLDTGNLDIYTGEYVFVGSFVETSTNISSNRTTKFYTANSSTKVVKSYSPTGSALETWTTAGFPAHIAPSREDTILYYADGTNGGAIQRWDLVNFTALTDLVAGVAGYTTRELFVLEDGTILVLRRQIADTTVFTLIRYSAAGAVLTTYSTLLTDSDTSDAHLAFANDDPDSFWVWFKIADGFSRWINVDTAAATATTTLEQIHYTSGSYDGVETDTPDSRFGASESCTFLITRMGSIPDTTFTTDIIIPRRQRRAPHLSREQLWNFYSQFQLDLEAGIGLTSGYGSDPQILLRWSDDGGHTWSNEHWMSGGRRGQYAFRAIERRLGRSRDRVFEVTVSDPVAWNLLAAYLQVDPGTS